MSLFSAAWIHWEWKFTTFKYSLSFKMFGNDEGWINATWRLHHANIVLYVQMHAGSFMTWCLWGKMQRFCPVFLPNIRSLRAKKVTGEEEEGWYLMRKKVRFKGLGWPHLPVGTRVELRHDSYRLSVRKQSPICGWEADNRHREEDMWHYTQNINACKSSHFRQTHRCISSQHV